MTRLPDIASLWIGDRLSWLEQLCLKSFADAGHRVRLYSYAGIDNLPEGVLAGDANDIFPGEPMYRHAKNGSPAIHADLFRLNLLARTESIWVDADMYCLRPFDLVADGAPQTLLEDLPASVVEVESPTMREVRRLIMQLPEVVDAAQLGSRLHALVLPHIDDPAGTLRQALDAAGMQAELRRVRPNLEDVFVMATRESS